MIERTILYNGKEYSTVYFLAGLNVIADPDLATGDVKFLPKYDPPLLIVGAGEYVDSVPAKEPTLEELRSKLAELNAPKAKVIDEAAERKKLLDAIAKAEKA